jgi:hypothetical protein
LGPLIKSPAESVTNQKKSEGNHEKARRRTQSLADMPLMAYYMMRQELNEAGSLCGIVAGRSPGVA